MIFGNAELKVDSLVSGNVKVCGNSVVGAGQKITSEPSPSLCEEILPPPPPAAMPT